MVSPAGAGPRDLSATAGLPLGLAGAGPPLVFGSGLPAVEPSVRRLEELRPVLADPAATGPDELYWMYRRVGWPAELAVLDRLHLRYDVTVLRPARLGREFNKTLGHYHPPADPAAGFASAYPEIYEVVAGQACFVLQRPAGGDPEAGALEDVVLVTAAPGDRVVIPPGYGHVTCNPGAGPLVLANATDSRFASLYGPLVGRRGGACYLLEGAAGIEAVANPAYGPPPPLRRVGPPSGLDGLGLPAGEPLYRCLVGAPDRFGYLSAPHLAAVDWDRLVGR